MYIRIYLYMYIYVYIYTYMNGCYRSRVIRAEIVIEKVTSLILLVECIPRKRGCTLQRLAFCKLPSVHEKHPHARTHWLRFSHFLSVCLSFCLHEKPQKNQDENTIFILQLFIQVPIHVRVTVQDQDQVPPCIHVQVTIKIKCLYMFKVTGVFRQYLSRATGGVPSRGSTF